MATIPSAFPSSADFAISTISVKFEESLTKTGMLVDSFTLEVISLTSLGSDPISSP